MAADRFPNYKIRKETSSKGLGNQLLSLSLFIILLAFFVLLNATSEYDEKTSRSVMQSIERSFASQMTGENNLPAKIADPRQAAGAGDAFDRIEGILKAQSVPFEAKRMDGNAALYVELDKKAFLKLIGITDVTDPELVDEFLGKLIVLLQPTDLLTQYQVRIALHTRLDPIVASKKSRKYIKDQILLIDEIANQFMQYGLDRELIEISLEQAKANKVTLYFDLYRSLEVGEIVKQPKNTGGQQLDVRSSEFGLGEG